jgi:uncharacterized membrane protein YfcA
VEFLKIFFPELGKEIYFFIPPLVSFVLSFFTSMAGVSGAFLLLPFQMSILGFTTPSVSATNFLYNVVGIPGGVIRYIREGRMSWPLAWITIAGTLPGVLFGYYARVKYFPDPRVFKLFVGLVLLYVALRLIKVQGGKKTPSSDKKDFTIRNVTWGIKRVEYDFMDEHLSFSVPALFFLAIVVGTIGGIYGIGGGAIIAPFCVTFLKLPVYTVAGAALLGTFATSILGVIFYSTIALNNGSPAPPDWLLGILFGLGGLLGMYLGAKLQKYIPEHIIKVVLALIIFSVSGKYILQFFFF